MQCTHQRVEFSCKLSDNSINERDFQKIVILYHKKKKRIQSPKNIYLPTFVAKGQLISKCLNEIIVWTKIPTKILIVSALALSGQKLSKILLVFWTKRRFQKYFLKLTDL